MHNECCDANLEDLDLTEMAIMDTRGGKEWEEHGGHELGGKEFID